MSDVSSFAATRTKHDHVSNATSQKGYPSRALTILANISSIIVDILELAQGLDDEDVLSRPCDNQLGSLVKAVVHNLECLQNVSPVLALVIESLVKHIHDLVEFGGPSAEGTAIVRGLVGWTGECLAESYELYVS